MKELIEGSWCFPTRHPEERSDEGSHYEILQPAACPRAQQRGLQDDQSGNNQKNSPTGQLIEKISEFPFWHNFFRSVLNGGQFREKIEPLIEVKESDKTLDICCGLGNYSLMFKGDYTGVDVDERYIGYAMKKYGSEKRKFICRDIRKIQFEKKYFDRAIMINAVRHFSDEENIKLFRKISSFVKEEFIIVDADLGTSNFVQKVLLDFDNGKYVRSVAEIEKLASTVFNVRKIVHFNTRTKSVSLCLIKCSIKREDENI